MKNLLLFSLSLLCFCFYSPSAQAQIFKNKKKEAPKKKKKEGKIKDISEILKEGTVSDSGLVNVHQLDDKYYFELSEDLLDRELLIVTRISGFVKGLNFGGAGVKSRPQQVIRWKKQGNKILLREVSYNSVASPDDPIYNSVINNNFEPVIHAFNIEGMKKDSSSYLIEVNPFFNSDIPMIGPVGSFQKKRFGIGRLDAKRSFINHINSYPENVEVRHVLSFSGSKLPDNQITNTLSVEMNQSIIVLPEEPMQPRLYDPRVAYFSLRQTDYSLDEHKTASRRFVTRWRMEPSDEEAYKRGELVEPKKPIVYYIDPATPTKWVPYIKQGVDDWQKSFEKIGFKNAIMAKEAPSPEEDPDWSPEDVRYSVIRYVSTDIQNAMGPHVHDPRTGEILESDIIWYHNIMKLLRNWYFIQTAAHNEEARGVKFDDEVMGELIRFVSAHEVGHTLGLPHNMGSSAAYPVDSLRSRKFTCKMGGTAPSIMDYARFNYIAQPEDSVDCIYPGIGPYDHWSIEYGYKPIFDANSYEEERITLNNWVKESAKDPYRRFGPQTWNPTDPTSQTEDLGDDAVLASTYGIANLKRLVPKLIEWSSEEAKGFENLAELYFNMLGQFNRYMGHVKSNIGGVYRYSKTSDEEGVIYTHVPRDKQKEALSFIQSQLFETPEWMISPEILQRIEPKGFVERISALQTISLRQILSEDRLVRMIENEALNGSEAYSLLSMIDDLETGIFKELSSGKSIDTYRRNLQRAYVQQMKRIIEGTSSNYDKTDIKAIARASLVDIKNVAGRYSNADKMSSVHADDLVLRIGEILDSKS